MLTLNPLWSKGGRADRSDSTLAIQGHQKVPIECRRLATCMAAKILAFNYPATAEVPGLSIDSGVFRLSADATDGISQSSKRGLMKFVSYYCDTAILLGIPSDRALSYIVACKIRLHNSY